MSVSAELTNRQLANRQLLKSLLALWDAVPDQRFGQLVMNVSRIEGGFADTWEWKHGEWLNRIADAYYVWTSDRGDANGQSGAQQ